MRFAYTISDISKEIISTFLPRLAALTAKFPNIIDLPTLVGAEITAKHFPSAKTPPPVFSSINLKPVGSLF